MIDKLLDDFSNEIFKFINYILKEKLNYNLEIAKIFDLDKDILDKL